MAKIGFIGMGNMGYAMLKGALKVFEKDYQKEQCIGKKYGRRDGGAFRGEQCGTCE